MLILDSNSVILQGENKQKNWNEREERMIAYGEKGKMKVFDDIYLWY